MSATELIQKVAALPQLEKTLFDQLFKTMNKSSIINTFSELIGEREFFIPSYQRAYSWTEKQIDLFISDIAEHARNKTQYYLGHYILERDRGNKFAVIDGQQRLTTVRILLAVCQFLKASPPLLCLRLHLVDYDDTRFQEILLLGNLAPLLADLERRREHTASLNRVIVAIQTFHRSFSTDERGKRALLSKNDIDAYLDVIRNAAVSVGEYNDKAVAAQIFELHNTRGVPLTETEKVKALLMKYVYINSSDRDRDVSEIQYSFADVFKLEEEAETASLRAEMSLDDILAHHLRAFDQDNDEMPFTHPPNVEGEQGCLTYVRNKLDKFDIKQSGVEYAKTLANEFARSMQLVSKDFVERDRQEPLVGDIILLDSRRSMVLLLRYFRKLNGQSPDHVLLERWESFLFLWDFHGAFYNMKSSWRDSFADIYKLIISDCTQVSKRLSEYYCGKVKFAYWPFLSRAKNEKDEEVQIPGLAGVVRGYIAEHRRDFLENAYNLPRWRARFTYWLYKYEIDSENITANSDHVRSSLRKLFKENAVTLDHIVPHGLEWKELSMKGEPDNDIKLWKDAADIGQAKQIREDIRKIINGIGNLVLLHHSDNASLQNGAPARRAVQYKILELESISYKEVGFPDVCNGY